VFFACYVLGWGWQALEKQQGRGAEAVEAMKSFQRAWRHADTDLPSSCPTFSEIPGRSTMHI
jgi:hypothetical protein